MVIDRNAFFSAIKRPVVYGRTTLAPLFTKMSQSQVDGLNSLLDAFEAAGVSDPRHIAYMLATAYHETAQAMLPVMETRQSGEARNPSVDAAIRRLENSYAAGRLTWVKKPYWRKDMTGRSWLGRGYVQVTHRENYARAERELGIAFTANPELMLEPGPSAMAMIRGMSEGWFTGKKLSDYINDRETDYREARRIINGTESASKIEAYARSFASAIVPAKSAAPPKPTPPAPRPAEPVANPAPASSIWARFFSLFR